MTWGMGISKAPFTVSGKAGYFYKVDGRRLSLDAKTEVEAVRNLNALRKLYFEGRLKRISGDNACGKSLQTFADEYLDWAASARAKASYRADRYALQALSQVAKPSTRLDMLSLRHLDAIKALPGLKETSVNVYLRHLRALFHKAVEWGYLQRNPFAAVKQVAVPKAPPVYIHPQDVGRFLASIKDLDARRMVTCYIYSGRRRAELVNLDWQDVDMDGEMYTIRHAKNRETKAYAMHPMVKAVFRAIGPKMSGPVFERWRHPDTITHRVKDALRDFGLGHVHLHHMRHTFAVLLREEGVDVKTIADLMGHQDVRATEIYAHITDTAAANALRRIKGGPVNLG